MEINKIIKIIKQGEGERVEFKTSGSNLSHDICAFLNSNGGLILVGVDDKANIIGAKLSDQQKISDSLEGIEPLPEVKINKTKISDKWLLIVEVEKSDKLHSVGGRIYARIGANNRPLSSQEIIEKAAESLKLMFDELPNTESRLKCIDKKKVGDYLKQRSSLRGIKVGGNLEENMRQLKIVKKIGSRLKPTNAGVLFFSKEPQQFIGYAKVRLIKFTDEEMREYTESKEFIGALDKIVDDIGEYWAKNLAKVGGLQVKFKRQEFFEYPLDSLREALINALIHRNYFDPSEVRIFIFPNRIIIKNPGSFPPGITPEAPEHKARNPLLAQYMYDLGYIEKYGSGILKIKKECQEHPLVNVYFSLRPFITQVEFKKEKELNLDNVNQKILHYLRTGPKKSSEIAKFIAVSKQTVLTRLQDLLRVNLVEQKGKGPMVKYYLR